MNFKVIDRKDFQDTYREIMLFLLLVSPDKEVKNFGTFFNDPTKLSADLALDLFLSFREEIFGKTTISKEEIEQWLKFYK